MLAAQGGYRPDDDPINDDPELGLLGAVIRLAIRDATQSNDAHLSAEAWRFLRTVAPAVAERVETLETGGGQVVTSATWKNCERSIARLLGAQRNPVNGRGDQCDVGNAWLSIECKHRAHLPAWLHAAMCQAEKNAGERLAVVVLHETGQHYDQSYVVLRLDDFADLHCANRGE